MRIFIVPLWALALASGTQASVMFFNAVNDADNSVRRAEWLAAAGIVAGENFVDFEAIDVGTNLHGVALVGGLTVTHPSGEAIVQSATSFFGGSRPIDTRGMALRETSGAANIIRMSFASPVDYVGGFDIDMPGATLQAVLTDSTVVPFALDSTGSSGDTAEFWGVWRNDAARISAIEFVNTSGGDGEWGLDNLEYGLVPEPTSMLALGAGLALLARRRRG